MIIKESLELVEEYVNNCNKDCYNCEYGVMRTPVDGHCCPLDIIYEMLWEIEKGEIRNEIVI